MNVRIDFSRETTATSKDFELAKEFFTTARHGDKLAVKEVCTQNGILRFILIEEISRTELHLLFGILIGLTKTFPLIFQTD